MVVFCKEKQAEVVWSCGEEKRGFGEVTRKCMYMEVDGARPRVRPRKTCLEVVKNDMKSLGECRLFGLSCFEEEDCGGYVLLSADPGLSGTPL